MLQRGREADANHLFDAAGELLSCDGERGCGAVRAWHRRRTRACQSESKRPLAQRRREFRQGVRDASSIRVFLALCVAVASLRAPTSAGSSARHDTPETLRVGIRDPSTFGGSGGVLRLRGRACEQARPCLPLSAKLRSAAADTTPRPEDRPAAPTAAWGCAQDGPLFYSPSRTHLRARLRGGGSVYAAPGPQGVSHQVSLPVFPPTVAALSTPGPCHPPPLTNVCIDCPDHRGRRCSRKEAPHSIHLQHPVPPVPPRPS